MAVDDFDLFLESKFEIRVDIVENALLESVSQIPSKLVAADEKAAISGEIAEAIRKIRLYGP